MDVQELIESARIEALGASTISGVVAGYDEALAGVLLGTIHCVTQLADALEALNRENKTLTERIAGVTRIEVIDAEGRAFTRWYRDQGVTLQLQDDDRTLKVFAGHPEIPLNPHLEGEVAR